MLKIEFSTGNDAFAGESGFAECSAILIKIADLVSIGAKSGKVRDSNGNTIGEWSLTIEADQEDGE